MQTHQFGSLPQTADATQTNRVLRNTYALLGLSMIPTVIGAILGVQLTPMLASVGGVVFAIAFLVVAFGLIFAIRANRNSGVGVGLLLLFTFFMGVMLGPLLTMALHFRNGAQMIALAAGGTGAIFFTLAGIAATTKRDFSNMGKFLFVGLILLILCSLANLFFQVPAFALALNAIAILIFSGYVLYDINRIVHGGETSYVSATLSVYLDILNIFTNLLQLLMAFMGDD